MTDSVYIDDQPFDERLIAIGKKSQESAKAHLGDLIQTSKRIGEAIAEASDPRVLEDLKGLLDQAKQASARSQIEKNLATLTDRQLEAIGAWDSREFKTIGCCGTNRSGKSFVAGTAYAKYLRDEAPPNSEHVCVTIEQRLSAKSQQKMLWDNIPHEMFDTPWSGPRNGFGSRNPVSVLDKGGRNVIVYWMTESEFQNNLLAFEAMSLETSWIDEAVSHELFSAVKARLTLSDDGRCLISAIPMSDFFWEVIYNAKPEDGVWYKLFTPQTNPTMTPAKWAELCRSVPPHERDVRLRGVPAMAGGIVFTEFIPEHIVAPRDIPDDLTWYTSLDYGCDHPTVFLLAGMDKDGVLWFVDEYVSRNQTPVEDVEGIKAVMGKRKPAKGYTYIDPSAFNITKANHVSIGQQYTQAGLPVISSRRTSDVGEHNQIYQIKEMLRCDEIRVSENCPQLIKELRTLHYKRDRQNKAMTKDAIVDVGNDAIDAMRYLVTMNPTYSVGNQKPRIIYT